MEFRYVIIDDEDIIRRGTIKKLKPLEVEGVICIGEASNGKIGLELIAEKQPDFVILDMQMPIMDGTTLLPLLAEKYPEMPLLVISGYRDFDYIKQAISANAVDYILKPFSKDQIQENVCKIIRRLENHTRITNEIIDSRQQKESAYYENDIHQLLNLIMGYSTSSFSFSSSQLSPFNDRNYRCRLAFLYYPSTTNHPDIRQWLIDMGCSDLYLYIESAEMPSCGFLLSFVPAKTAQMPEGPGLTDQLYDWITSTDCPVIIGRSLLHNKLGELNQAFTETTIALNQQPVAGKSTPIYLYTGEKELRSLVWEREEEFVFRMESGAEKEIPELLDHLFLLYAGNANATLADLKYHCSQLSDVCRKLLLDNGEKITPSQSMQKVVNRIFSPAELKLYYLQFFSNICQLFAVSGIYAGKDPIDQMKIYLQRNYRKDISQDLMASLFYMNRSYLSTLFKTRTGMKFIDYLNQVRIEQSKKLLTETDQKMYQIAKNVGYDNVKYFFRVFKKTTGVTPEIYRSQYK